MLAEVISLVVGVCLLMFVSMGGLRGLSYLIDLPSLILVIIFTLPVIIGGGFWKDFQRAFKLLSKKYTCKLSEMKRALDVVELVQKQLVCAAILVSFVSFVVIMTQVTEMQLIGPNLAVACLSGFYTVILEMLLLPVKMKIQTRIADYMEEN